MKKIVSLILLFLFVSAFLRSQTALEIGLQGMQHLNSYDLQYADNSLNADGSSCGIRFGALAGKNLFQASLLYSKAHVPQLAQVNTEQSDEPQAPEKVGLGLMLMARHHFNSHKKVFGFIAGGVSGFIFNRSTQYNSSAGPTFPGQTGSSRYDLAAILVPGVRCRLSDNFSLDLEPGLKYYFLENSYYKNNLAYSLGITLNYLFARKEPAPAIQ